MKYTPIIGLEVHIEQNTKSKMFCPCPAKHFSIKPNTHTCPTCLGLPGALPFANQHAIESTIKFGLALNCKINKLSKFDRKHYFYPDLPKAYQISQYDLPLCEKGKYKNINITRIHLEEDTGKLVHTTIDNKKISLIDFNRSGVPLMELVTEPDFRSKDDAVNFLKDIQLITRYLNISDADMEKGSMRLEANISLSKDEKLPNYKVELKNINSFKFLSKALTAEIKRQTEAFDNNQKLIQETRGFNQKTNKTFSQRVKEGSSDYRYFPEPDIPPLTITDTDIKTITDTIPELPEEIKNKLVNNYKLSDHYSDTLILSQARINYFEKAIKLAKKYNISPLLIAKVMVNQNLDNKYQTPAELIKYLYSLSQKSYANISEVKIAITKIIKSNPKAVSDYQEGSGKVIGYLIGLVQKELKGTGDPKQIQQILLKSLQNSSAGD